MREKNFQDEFKQSIEALLNPVHFRKIPDSINPGTWGASRFIPVKPYDCYFVYKNIFHAFELKMKKSKVGLCIQSFSKKKNKETGGDLKRHQEKALLEVHEAGSPAFLLINYRFSDKNNLKTNIVFVIHILDFIKHRDKILNETGKKSISFDYFYEHFTSIERLHFPNAGTCWDIFSLLRIIEDKDTNT